MSEFTSIKPDHATAAGDIWKDLHAMKIELTTTIGEILQHYYTIMQKYGICEHMKSTENSSTGYTGESVVYKSAWLSYVHSYMTLLEMIDQNKPEEIYQYPAVKNS